MNLQKLEKNRYYYFNRGRVKENLKDYAGAILDYDKAIELNPNLKNSSLFECNYEKYRMELLNKK